ncbi:hypothetical protein QBC42DRAFT_299741 [Cladorrhinum samala]|uniref:Uncharacterized protein n=1 Tax=Cladorrhinum samala TaxID=585594 RepID=A0AAV9HEG4_9PEZI|nr:hypothetical protein QBC42DRAFT_299741 [Cladorrhinum samala]
MASKDSKQPGSKGQKDAAEEEKSGGEVFAGAGMGEFSNVINPPPTKDRSRPPRAGSTQHAAAREASRFSARSDSSNVETYDSLEAHDPWTKGGKPWTEEHYNRLVTALNEELTDPVHNGLFSITDPDGHLQRVIRASADDGAQVAWNKLLNRVDVLIKARIDYIQMLGQTNQILTKEREDHQGDKQTIEKLRKQTDDLDRELIRLEEVYAETLEKHDAEVHALRENAKARDRERGNRIAGGEETSEDSGKQNVAIKIREELRIEREFRKAAEEESRNTIEALQTENMSLTAALEKIQDEKTKLQGELERVAKEKEVVHKGVSETKKGGSTSTSIESSAIHELKPERLQESNVLDAYLLQDQIEELKQRLAARDQSQGHTDPGGQLAKESDAYQAEIANLQANHAQELENLKSNHEKELEAHTRQIADLEADHARQIKDLKARHEKETESYKAKLSKLRSDHSKQLTDLRGHHAREIENHQKELAKLQSDHAQQFKDLHNKHRKEVEHYQKEIKALNSNLTARDARNAQPTDEVIRLKESRSARENELSERVDVATGERDALQKQIEDLRASLDEIQEQLTYFDQESKNPANTALTQDVVRQAGKHKAIQSIQDLVRSLSRLPPSRSASTVTSSTDSKRSASGRTPPSRLPRRSANPSTGRLPGKAEDSSSSSSVRFVRSPQASSKLSSPSGGSGGAQHSSAQSLQTSKYKEDTGYPETMFQDDFDNEVAILDQDISQLKPLSRSTGETEEQFRDRIRALQRRADELSGYNTHNDAAKKTIEEGMKVLEALGGRYLRDGEQATQPSDLLECLDTAVGIIEDFKDKAAAAYDDADEIRKAVRACLAPLNRVLQKLQKIEPKGPAQREITNLAITVRDWARTLDSDTQPPTAIRERMDEHERNLGKLVGWHWHEFPLDAKRLASVSRRIQALQENGEAAEQIAEKYRAYKATWGNSLPERSDKSQLDSLAAEFIDGGAWTRPYALEKLLHQVGDLLPGHASMEEQRNELRKTLDSIEEEILDLDSRLDHLNGQAEEKQAHIDNHGILRNVGKLKRHKQFLLDGYKRCKRDLDALQQNVSQPLESFYRTEAGAATERVESVVSTTLLNLSAAAKKPDPPKHDTKRHEGSQTELPSRGQQGTQTQSLGKRDGGSQTELPSRRQQGAQTQSLVRRDGSSQTEPHSRRQQGTQTQSVVRRDEGSQTKPPAPPPPREQRATQTQSLAKKDEGSQTKPPTKGQQGTQTQLLAERDEGSQTEAPAPVTPEISNPHLAGACFCTILAWLWPRAYSRIVKGGCCSAGRMLNPTVSGKQPANPGNGQTCRGHHGHGRLSASGDVYTIICNILTALLWLVGLFIYSPLDFAFFGLSIAALALTPFNWIRLYIQFVIKYTWYKLIEEGEEINSFDTNHPRAHPTLRGPAGRPIYKAPKKPGYPWNFRPGAFTPARIVSFLIVMWTTYVTLIWAATWYEREIWRGANTWSKWRGSGPNARVSVKDRVVYAGMVVDEIPYPTWSPVSADFGLLVEQVVRVCGGWIHGLFYETGSRLGSSFADGSAVLAQRYWGSRAEEL